MPPAERRRTVLASAALLLVLVILALAIRPPDRVDDTDDGGILRPVEHPVTLIPLAPPLDDPRAEISGLAWYGDWLILLPQYPNWDARETDGSLYAIHRTDILDYLDGQRSAPPEVRSIPLHAPGLTRKVGGYQGFEALAFQGDRVFLLIEAGTGAEMSGYLVGGSIAPDLSEITLNVDALHRTATPISIPNAGYESLVIADDHLLAFYEGNGACLSHTLAALLFDTEMTPLGTLPFPSIEWRITDATAVDSTGRFWAINFGFPGSLEYNCGRDPLAEQYGEGSTHAASAVVERLVELAYSPSGITLVEQAPLQLELAAEARNWEGIVRLDGRGFLLATDRYPTTLLGFVAWPQIKND
ncbi:MAG: hypothetical protein Kow00124_31050 [Anaerolineae bacterium]